MNEAAQAAGVSQSTIVRRRRAGAFPNAERGQAGEWLIPLGDLLAAGLRVNAPDWPVTTVTMPQSVTAVSEPAAPVTVTLGEYRDLVERASRADALSVEVEHLRALVDRLTQPQIEAPPEAVRISDTSPPGKAAALVDLRDEAPSRRWFRRR